MDSRCTHGGSTPLVNACDQKKCKSPTQTLMWSALTRHTCNTPATGGQCFALGMDVPVRWIVFNCLTNGSFWSAQLRETGGAIDTKDRYISASLGNQPKKKAASQTHRGEHRHRTAHMNAKNNKAGSRRIASQSGWTQRSWPLAASTAEKGKP